MSTTLRPILIAPALPSHPVGAALPHPSHPGRVAPIRVTSVESSALVEDEGASVAAAVAA